MVDASSVFYEDYSLESSAVSQHKAPTSKRSVRHRFLKWFFDKTLAFAVLPFIGLISLFLLIANPLFNPGPLFFHQERMGIGGSRFILWKFRTMCPEGEGVRGQFEALEEHRITPLGRILRRSRIDEMPNFFNVLIGEMSVIGPRPEVWSHAVAHIEKVSRYRERFLVLPGITGLAQVRLGYADTEALIRRKARLDRLYVRRSSLGMDMRIAALTIPVMIAGIGAK